MTILRMILFPLLIFVCFSSMANFEEIAKLPEAKVLVETRIYLQSIKEKVKQGKKLDRDLLLKKAEQLEVIANNGCECETLIQEDLIRSHAYTQTAAIYGILSQKNHNVALGLKSYKALEKARILVPHNTDAMKGQAIALNKILSKNWGVRKMVAVTLGINLKDAARELISDMRQFSERKDLQYWAKNLEEKL